MQVMFDFVCLRIIGKEPVAVFKRVFNGAVRTDAVQPCLEAVPLRIDADKSLAFPVSPTFVTSEFIGLYMSNLNFVIVAGLF
jgi:hypothetical protein